MSTNDNLHLFVVGFPKETNLRHLEEHFRKIVPSIAIVNMSRVDYETHGLVIIDFDSLEDVRRAIDFVNYSVFNGSELQLLPSVPSEIQLHEKESLYVKNLPADMKSKDLCNLFLPFGEIMSCRVKYNKKGKCKGFGFVHFRSAVSATKALEVMNRKVFHKHKLEVVPYIKEGKKEYDITNGLCIKCIPPRFTDEDLAKLIDDENLLSAVVAKRSNFDKTNRGFGFARFKDSDSMIAAKERLNGRMVERIKLVVEETISREDYKKLKRFEKHENCILRVKNLPENYTDDDLIKDFQEFGNIRAAKIFLRPKDEETGMVKSKPKRYGLVCFRTLEDTKKAFEAYTTGNKSNSGLRVFMAKNREGEEEAVVEPETHDKVIDSPPEPTSSPPVASVISSISHIVRLKCNE